MLNFDSRRNLMRGPKGYQFRLPVKSFQSIRYKSLKIKIFQWNLSKADTIGAIK